MGIEPQQKTTKFESILPFIHCAPMAMRKKYCELVRKYSHFVTTNVNDAKGNNFFTLTLLIARQTYKTYFVYYKVK